MRKLLAFTAVCLALLSTASITVVAHSCVDKNRDYWCDDCGMLIYHTCIDANKDTWCDRCGCWIPHDCADKDGDHECDQCGRVMDVNVNITVTSSLPEYTATVYFYESTLPGVFKILAGSPASHTFRCAANSRFQLQVTKYGHPARTFFCNTYHDDINIDAQMYPYGDASQDGRVNVGDVSRIYSHVRDTGSITDDYALACADASGDGKLNMGDISRVYSHIRETKPLF